MTALYSRYVNAYPCLEVKRIRWRGETGEFADPHFGEIGKISASEVFFLTLFTGEFSLGEITENLIKSYVEDKINVQKIIEDLLRKRASLISFKQKPTKNFNFINPPTKSIFEDSIKKLSFPSTISLYVNEICNLDCNYCSSKGNEKLNSKIVNKVLDECISNNVLKINFGIGEPFLDEDIISYVEKCVAHGIFPYISTNGILLNRTVVQELIRSRLPSIQISLDTLSPEKFFRISRSRNIDIIKQNLEYAIKAGLLITVRTVLSSENRNELEALVNYCFEKGVSRHTITPVITTSNAKSTDSQMLPNEDLKQVETRIRELRETEGKNVYFSDIKPWKTKEECSICSGLFSTLNVRANGDISICAFYDYIYGNVYKQSLQKAWNSDKLEELRGILLNRDKVNPVCSDCSYFDRCFTGCVDQKKQHNIPLNGIDPRCVMSSTQM